MSEIVTTITGFELKPGESASGTYVLSKFSADDGKKYQTFDEELAERVKARVGQSSRVVFESQQRTNNGRTFTNNVITDIMDPNAAASSNGSSVVATPATLERIAAFEAGVQLVSVVSPESFDFASVTRAAEGILAWAKGELAGSDPEDITTDDDAKEVPN